MDVDLVVVGAGVVGLAAAAVCARAGLDREFRPAEIVTIAERVSELEVGVERGRLCPKLGSDPRRNVLSDR